MSGELKVTVVTSDGVTTVTARPTGQVVDGLAEYVAELPGPLDKSQILDVEIDRLPARSTVVLSFDETP